MCPPDARVTACEQDTRLAEVTKDCYCTVWTDYLLIQPGGAQMLVEVSVGREKVQMEHTSLLPCLLFLSAGTFLGALQISTGTGMGRAVSTGW